MQLSTAAASLQLLKSSGQCCGQCACGSCGVAVCSAAGAAEQSGVQRPQPSQRSAAVRSSSQSSSPAAAERDSSACRAEACSGSAITCNHLACVRARAHSMMQNAICCVREVQLTSVNHNLHLTTGKTVEAAAAAAPRTVPAPRTVHNSTPQNTCNHACNGSLLRAHRAPPGFLTLVVGRFLAISPPLLTLLGALSVSPGPNVRRGGRGEGEV